MVGENDFKAGKRIQEDIKSKNGQLLLANHTLLKEEHLQKLKQHHLLSSDESGSETRGMHKSAEEWEQLVVEASKEVESIFNVIRYHNQVPIMDIKTKVLPTIKEMSNHFNMLSLLTSLENNDKYT